MARVAVVTAIYGGRDTPKPQVPQDVDVEWFLFSEEQLEAPAPWQVVHEPPAYEHPCMAAKLAKMFPRLPHRRVVWVDGSMEITSPAFAREALGCVNDGIAVWRHPRRDCIYEEAEASLGAESQGGRYGELPIREQMIAYQREGHPLHAGLFACGTVAWDRAIAGELGDAWLRECERWGYQDQLSLPVVCRRAGVRPGVFPHPQIVRSRNGALENPWLRIHPHSG